MTRKHLIAAAAAVLIMTLVCLCTAFADDPVKVTMDFSASQFTGPKTIDVKISVTNTGDTEMPGPVTLYYPSGKQVEEFGSPTLGVGESREWSGAWTVTEDELQSGKITFKIKYSINNENGELVNKTKNFSKKISYAGSEPQLAIERIVKPSVAEKGQKVIVTYQFSNNGASDVTGITVKENSSISSKSQSIDSLPAGEKKSVVFTATMGTKDLTSASVITYKLGGKTYTEKKEAVVIKNGVNPLTATLTADKKGGMPGDTLHLTLKIKNNGKTDVSNITVTDDNLGTLFSGETVPAGTTVTLEKDAVMNETADIQLSVKGEISEGETAETATEPAHWTAIDPDKQVVLSVKAKADRESVYEIPGTVRFTVSVKNESPIEVKKIPVKAASMTLYTFESIPAGEEKSFTRDVAVSMPGKFRFDAVYTDELGQKQTFSSEVIPIELINVTPAPTSTPIITPEPPEYEDIPTDADDVLPGWMKTVQSLAGSLKWVLLGLTVMLLALLAIAVLKRILAKVHSAGAMDHLEGSNYRDYSVAPKRGKRNEISDQADQEKIEEKERKEKESAEGTAQDSTLVAETLRRLYTDDKQQAPTTDADAAASGKEKADAAPPETDNTKAEGLSRKDTEEPTAKNDTEMHAPEKDGNASGSENGSLGQKIAKEIQSAAIYRRIKKKQEFAPNNNGKGKDSSTVPDAEPGADAAPQGEPAEKEAENKASEGRKGTFEQLGMSFSEQAGGETKPTPKDK